MPEDLSNLRGVIASGGHVEDRPPEEDPPTIKDMIQARERREVRAFITKSAVMIGRADCASDYGHPAEVLREVLEAIGITVVNEEDEV